MSNDKKKQPKRLGWHFLPADRRLTNGDDRKVTVGQKLSMRGPEPILCSFGMHASERVSDAAKYQRGPMLCRVEVWGDIAEGDDKFCGRYRRVNWMKLITRRDLNSIAHVMGARAYPSCLVDQLAELAKANPDKFNASVEAWARKHGASDKLHEGVERPRLEESHLLRFMMPRVVRTAKEIRRDVGDFYDLTPDGFSYSDRIAELLVGCNRICTIHNIDGLGGRGYVLQSRRR
jgi:hypothetical protein